MTPAGGTRGNVIDRNRDELEAHGTLEVFDYRSKTPAGGRPGRQYLLNEAQALALVALMRTPKTRELRVALVRLFADDAGRPAEVFRAVTDGYERSPSPFASRGAA